MKYLLPATLTLLTVYNGVLLYKSCKRIKTIKAGRVLR